MRCSWLHQVPQDFILDALQRASLDERFGIERHIVAFVDEHRKPDSRDGSESGIAENCRDAEVFVVHDACYHIEQL